MPQISTDVRALPLARNAARTTSGRGGRLRLSLEAQPRGRHFTGGPLHQVCVVRDVPGVSGRLHRSVVAEDMLVN